MAAREGGLDSKKFQRALRSVLEELYELIGRPVIERLRLLGVQEQSRVWWCPTSVFCSLPLHAMGPIPSRDGVKQFFSDLYIPSYTPSLSALIESRRSRAQRGGPRCHRRTGLSLGLSYRGADARKHRRRGAPPRRRGAILRVQERRRDDVGGGGYGPWRDLAENFYRSVMLSGDDDGRLGGLGPGGGVALPYHARFAKALRDAVRKLRRKNGVTLERLGEFRSLWRVIGEVPAATVPFSEKRF